MTDPTAAPRDNAAHKPAGLPSERRPHADPMLPSERSFGLLMAAVLSLLAGWLLWKGHAGGTAVAGALAVVLAAVAWRAPTWLAPANRIWFRLGMLMNAVVSPLVLGLMFFGLITPIALVFRLTGRDVLMRGFECERVSYWIERNPPGPKGDSLKNQF